MIFWKNKQKYNFKGIFLNKSILFIALARDDFLLNFNNLTNYDNL